MSCGNHFDDNDDNNKDNCVRQKKYGNVSDALFDEIDDKTEDKHVSIDVDDLMEKNDKESYNDEDVELELDMEYGRDLTVSIILILTKNITIY